MSPPLQKKSLTSAVLFLWEMATTVAARLDLPRQLLEWEGGPTVSYCLPWATVGEKETSAHVSNSPWNLCHNCLACSLSKVDEQIFIVTKVNTKGISKLTVVDRLEKKEQIDPYVS